MLRRTKIVIAPGWEDWMRRAGLDRVESVYAPGSGELVTQTGSTEVRRVPLVQGAESRTVFVKRYWVSRPAQLWSGMFRGTFFGRSKARREFENLNRLRQWGLHAPAAVAYGEERQAGWLFRSFLISEGIPDPVPLHQFIREHWSANTNLSDRRRAELISQLARATRLLHERQFVHHDYFWRNILLAEAKLDRFFLIDAHKGRRWYPGESARARAQDLAALDAPAPAFFRRPERLRFFLLYLGQPRLDEPAKKLLRRVLAVAEPMRARQLRRVQGNAGQPVQLPSAP